MAALFIDRRLFAQHQPLYRMCAAIAFVAIDHHGAESWITLGGFKASGHAGKKSLHDLIFLHPDHTVIRPGHATVCLIRSALGKYTIIGGGDMRMGSDHGGYATIKIPAHGHFLRCGLGVEIQKNNFGCDLLQYLVGLAEGIIIVLHEDAALQIDHGIGLALACLAFIPADAGYAFRIICGTQHPSNAAGGVGVGRLEILHNLALVPDVIAGGEHVAAEVKKLVGDLGSEPEAARGVFRVGDNKVNLVSFHYVREMVMDDFAPGTTEDVTDKENLHKKSNC